MHQFLKIITLFITVEAALSTKRVTLILASDNALAVILPCNEVLFQDNTRD